MLSITFNTNQSLRNYTGVADQVEMAKRIRFRHTARKAKEERREFGERLNWFAMWKVE